MGETFMARDYTRSPPIVIWIYPAKCSMQKLKLADEIPSKGA